MNSNIIIIIHLVILNNILIENIYGYNKYSKEANIAKDASSNENMDMDFRPASLKLLDKPFRMAKLNLLWSKAVIRLSETKLKSLFGELKLHDKEEITWKHLRAEGKDKDGLKEAELRKKLLTIMGNYNLLDQAEDVEDAKKYLPHRALNEPTVDDDKHINKSLFKDKKLNKLWAKAETAGFTNEELMALREEFNHHEDKIHQYYALLHDTKSVAEDDPDNQNNYENSVDDTIDKFNTIELKEDGPQDDKRNSHVAKVQQLRHHHKEIRDGFERLENLAAKGPTSREFVEPKVQGLWRIALDSNFTAAELESLRVELRHYENRLLKLRHLQAEQALHEEKYQDKLKLAGAGDKINNINMMEENIKKHARVRTLCTR